MIEHFSNRGGRALLVGAVLPIAAVASGLAATTASASTPTAMSLISAAKKAITAHRSVHFEVASVASGTNEHISADAGTAAGRQIISSGTKTATVLLTKTDAYFSGNSSGLSTFFGMPAADIKKVGTKWVDIKKGTTQYTSFKSGIVTASLDTSFFPTTTQAKTAKVVAASANGKAVYELKWTTTSGSTKVAETLNIDATGSDLPLTATGVSGKNHTTTTFSKWGESVNFPTPKSVISFTTLTG